MPSGSSLVGSRESESPILPASKRRPAREPVALPLELVDEAAERSPVAQAEPDDVERHPGQRTDLRLALCARDALAHAEERRQKPAHSPDVPDSIEFAHGDSVLPDAAAQTSLPAHGGRARGRAAQSRRLAVRAE